MARPAHIGWKRFMLGLVAGVWFGLLTASLAAEPEVTANNARALLLLKLSETTTWPAASRTNSTGGLVIGFLKAPEILTATKRMVAGDPNDRTVLVEVESPEAAAACHTIYFGRLDTAGRELLATLKSKPVLTIGEGSGFLGADGIVGFEFREIGSSVKLGYFVNVPAMDRARIRLDPQALKSRIRTKEEP